MAAASSILVGLLLSSKTITEPGLNRVTRATTQIPWYLDLQNLARVCPGGHCDDTPIGLLKESFQNNDKECPGGRCGVAPINAIQARIHGRNKDCTRGRCDVTPIGLLHGNIHNRDEGCIGGHCNVNPIGLLQGNFQNRDKGCPGGWCDVTSNSPVLGTLQNIDRGCPGGRCEVTTEGPTLGGFQGTADPFEDYFVTESTLEYESDSLVTDPIIFSETSSFSKNAANENIQNSHPNSVVATFAPTVGEFTTSISSSASLVPPGNVVTVPSTSSIAPSRGFVYVDFGDAHNSYDGEGSIRVVSQEIANPRFQRQSTIVDNDYDFWNSINGILGGELGFLNEQTFNQHSNSNNNNIHQSSARNINSNNAAALIEESRDARSFTNYPGGSVGVPSQGFITVDFGGNPDDWGPGGFIRVVSHE